VAVSILGTLLPIAPLLSKIYFYFKHPSPIELIPFVNALLTDRIGIRRCDVRFQTNASQLLEVRHRKYRTTSLSCIEFIILNGLST
jgi:hypothetical protein